MGKRLDENYLKEVLWVQETYLRHSKEISGLSNREVLRRFINVDNRRKISERTLYNYLNTPAKKLLKELNKSKKDGQ
ncbi:MAG: hypothetical protein N4A74_07495 [Carboxylicivirga sp.]|jgi:hypothetical protein|nr:hypothetical protein [Carboxylicivirga sp.]